MVTATAARFDTGTAVSFECEGCRLYGALHRPADPAQGKTAVILLNQGPVDRAGSHRLYIKLAHQLTALGYSVLRFDARGVGESEGLWEGEPQSLSVLDVYARIQRGAWADDTRAAIDYLRTSHGIDRVILGGLCGGACTAVFAGASHPAVDGMFVIGAPITFASATRRVADLPQAIVEREAKGYLRKLMRPSSWKRVLTFQSDYKMAARVFVVRMQRVLRPNQAAENDSNVNMPMLKAIQDAAKRRKRILFVFGENDVLWQEFQEHLPRFGARLPFELKTIPEGNHVLTEEPWQQALFTHVSDWLVPAREGAQRRLA